jgi:hypothetical protein
VPVQGPLTKAETEILAGGFLKSREPNRPLVIGYFGWAGRMVHMPRVPDGRAGCAGGIPSRAGYVNICKQSPESMLGALTCCWGHLAGVSGGVKT